jgi:antitoxin VapB
MVETSGGKVESVPSLNIKNEETHRLAVDLARLTGENVTTAVTVAIRERLERQKPNPKAGLAAWLEEMTRYTAAAMNDGRSSTELIEELYDPETGLPR